MDPTRIRQVAILLNSLDPDTADMLLESLLPHQRRDAQEAVGNLGPVGDDERAFVLSNFYQNLAEENVTDQLPPLVDASLDDETTLDTEEVEAYAFTHPRTRPELAALCQALATHPTTSLAERFVGEHDQTCAVVAAALTPSRAAAFVAQLSLTRQPEVLQRLAHLGRLDTATVEALAESVEGLSPGTSAAAANAENVQQLRQMIQHFDVGVRSRVMHQLTTHNQVLAEALQPVASGPPDKRGPHGGRSPRASQLTMDRLIDFETSTIRELFASIAPQVTALALMGASHNYAEELLSRLDASGRRAIDTAIGQIGSWRLSDAENAQRHLLQQARRLAQPTGERPNLKLIA